MISEIYFRNSEAKVRMASIGTDKNQNTFIIDELGKNTFESLISQQSSNSNHQLPKIVLIK